MTAPVAFIGGLGGPELIIVGLIAVLLFGANKIPRLARSMGEASGEFQKGREELEQDIDDATPDIESTSTPVDDVIEDTNPGSEAGE